MQALKPMSHWYTPSEPAGVVDGHVLLTPEAASDDWLAKVYDEDGYLLGGEAVQADGHFSVALLRTPVSPQLVVHVSCLGGGVFMANTVLQAGKAQVTVLQDPVAPAPAVQIKISLEEPPVLHERPTVPTIAPVHDRFAQNEAVWVDKPEPAAIDAAPLVVMLRGQQVLLDSDLAHLCGVLPRRLGEQTKLNKHLFSATDVFQLSPDEKAHCVAHVPRLNKLRHSVALPYAFNEAGALLLAQQLSKPLAKQRMAQVVKAFNSNQNKFN